VNVKGSPPENPRNKWHYNAPRIPRIQYCTQPISKPKNNETIDKMKIAFPKKSTLPKLCNHEVYVMSRKKRIAKKLTPEIGTLSQKIQRHCT
jgi:hypothetical protein